jgi:cob(I)alamin adenosyltransferase
MTRVRVYTRTGDGGTTGLLDGSRVAKDDPRLEAYGTVDETQACLGEVEARLAASESSPWRDQLVVQLARVQSTLFALNAALADPSGCVVKRVGVDADEIAALEGWMDAMLDAIPPQTRFVRPGVTMLQAGLNVARTVCRRAERRIAALGPGTFPEVGLRYVNRLSDFLFVASRYVVYRQGHEEQHF